MTVFDDLGSLVLDRMLSDQVGMQALITIKNNLSSGKYGYWKDIVFQEWDRFEAANALVNAACYAQIHTSLHLGQIAMCQIHIGSTPHADKEQELNSSDLARGLSGLIDSRNRLPSPSFSGEFWGGHGVDSDGTIEWKGNAAFTIFREGSQDKEIAISDYVVPLEVGYTKAARTLHHLMFSRGIARWAYESEYLYILKVIDNGLWSPNFRYTPRSI